MIFDAAGNLYGTAQFGGTYGDGTVFELTPRANGSWAYKVLYNFGIDTDGDEPAGTLIFDAAGNLYGTTYSGGTHGGGTVFELTPTGATWTEQLLLSFGSDKRVEDGIHPLGGVIFDAAGNLYGTTQYGGAYGEGTVFETDAHGRRDWTEETLVSFFPLRMGGTNPTGGLTLDAAGNLYGTTYWGGPWSLWHGVRVDTRGGWVLTRSSCMVSPTMTARKGAIPPTAASSSMPPAIFTALRPMAVAFLPAVEPSLR